MPSKNILIVEDQAVFRRGLLAIFQDYAEEFKVVGEAVNGHQAIAMTRQFNPDVILMDIHIPELDGIEATRIINRIAHETKKQIAILMLTFDNNAESVFAALQAGAKGYVLKEDGMEELLLSIRLVASGGAVYGPSIAARITNYFTNISRNVVIANRYPTLTKRESEVLAQVQKGEKNAQIAESLKLSTKTVSNHISNILNKLQVSSRSDLSGDTSPSDAKD